MSGSSAEVARSGSSAEVARETYIDIKIHNSKIYLKTKTLSTVLKMVNLLKQF